MASREECLRNLINRADEIRRELGWGHCVACRRYIDDDEQCAAIPDPSDPGAMAVLICNDCVAASGMLDRFYN